MELAWIYNISEKKEDHCRCISVVDKTIGQLLFFLVAQFPPTHPFYWNKMKATSPSSRDVEGCDHLHPFEGSSPSRA